MGHLILRRRGEEPETVWKEAGDMLRAVAAIQDDVASRLDESELPGCPVYSYRIACIVAQGEARPVRDGKKEVRTRIQYKSR